MSIAGNAGAQAAAGEIVRYIDELIAKERPTPGSHAHQLLLAVRKKADDIASTARAGWY